ncbi:restriction endonuclease subunit S [Phocaeicola faecium]|uniref:Restriction endonuclease subunit S n=1 Tax=Phocaeicola faecium TaxID=2762213 RepID=A0ABR8V8J5_9BACT|nr:restriction endonuclease subunit S [Phocaeicola faecium]MBD8001012.1 restriction endonuclease subunit S [Phocaeicola faecium]
MTDCIIPEGYKKTSLGVIPKEWEAVRIHEICTLVNGRAYKQNELLSEGKYKILRVGNFFTNDSWYFSDLELEANKYACKGDLLYAWSASFGPRFWTEEKVIYHYHIWKICDLKGVDKQYLYFFLDYDASLLQNAIQGGTMHHITKNDMEKRFIPLPPMEEQQNIAKVLNTWDKAIEKQTQLIEKLELRKKGLMQQLLTGKKRLPGFGGEWKKVKAGLLFGSSSIRSNKLEPLLSVTQDKGVVPRDMLETRVTMPNGDLSSFKLVDVGDFVISLRSFEGGLEYSKYRGIVSPAYTVLKKKTDLSDVFYKVYFKSNDFIQRLTVAVIGIRDGKQISYSDFCYIKIPYPSLQEQNAIANVFVSCDNEILLAKHKLNSFQQQKKGLMQVLLTGKKRVTL